MTERRFIPLILMAVGVGALSFAFVAQYLFGLEPCILCLYQRIPYAVVAVLGALALPQAMNAEARVALVGLCGIALLANSGIAFYHVGVEQAWWQSTCSGRLPDAMSVQDMMAQLNQPQQKSCEIVNWTFLGLSMATWNVPFAAGVGLFALGGAWRLWRREHPHHQTG